MLWICLLLCFLISGSLADQRGLEVVKVLKKEKIALQQGVPHDIELLLEGVPPDSSKDTLSSHMIMIEVQSTPSSRDVLMEHVIDLSARMLAPGHLTEFIDIKDTFPVQQGETSATMIYHYVVYDLCYLNNEIKEPPKIQLQLKSLDGGVLSEIDAKLVKFHHLKINWVDADSEWFIPREDHTSCQTWDQKVWVYGGRRNIDKNIYVMDDVMYYDSKMNKWSTGKSNGTLKPKPRYGHVMFCYFNYLIVFGGLSSNGELLGDLWVYDVVKELWIPVIDNQNVIELQSKNIEGVIPKERGYASAVMLKVVGAGYMVGGKNNIGFACDLWALKIDRIIQHVEDPQVVPLENFWIKKEFSEGATQQLCRFGHSTAEVKNHTFLIYGGIDQSNNVISTPLVYDVLAQKLTVLDEYGDYIPPARNKPALLSTGNNMVIMYGGVDPLKRGYLTDLWHFKVYDDKIWYQKVNYENNGTAYMVSWRSGFTMEYLRGINDPHLIGGTYGNNQASQALISMPEQECMDQQHFDSSTCSPCPRGSTYTKEINDCHWCEQYEYFEENYDNYFKSSCQPCPRGLIGGTYKSWVPCAGGYIFSARSKTHCRKCTDEELCPIGTKYAFPYKEFVGLIDEVKINDQPQLVIADELISDNTGTIVILTLVFSTLVIAILIWFCFIGFRERSLFIYREFDVIAITGGKRKKVVGGVLMIFFYVFIAVVWTGYLYDYMARNVRRESSETNNPFLNKNLPASYEIEIKAYISKVKESEAPFLIFHHDEEPDANKDDMWSKYHYKIQESTYFKYAGSTHFNCTRRRLNDFTDKYTFKAVYKNIPKNEIRDQFINLEVETATSQVTHFFKWRVRSVWEYDFADRPLAYSEVQGIMTPQAIKESNKNITTGFKGPDPTLLYFNLIPTHYVNEIEGIVRDGYRIHFADHIRGTTVNKRTLVNEYTASGEDFRGFKVQLWMTNNEMLFQVRVQKIKSILEVLSFMLGFLAGFILIVRVAKYYLLKETYFLELEKQWEQFFGRHNESKHEDDIDDFTNIELMKLERSRMRIREASNLMKEASLDDEEKSQVEISLDS